MFYPVNSLKRGSKFYLCWLADAWPLRFRTMAKEIRAHDLCESCNQLLEVIISESGIPSKRFSLRLSSQLMRGSARILERKADLLMHDLQNLRDQFHKRSNRDKDNEARRVRSPRRPHSARGQNTPTRRLQVLQPDAQQHFPLQPDVVNGIEELLRTSRNTVARNDDITLREEGIIEVQDAPTDNFGGLTVEETLRFLLDDAPEMMMVAPDTTGAHTSALGVPLDTTAQQSIEISRLLQPGNVEMEAIAELDQTLFRKSTAGDLLTVEGDVEKDAPRTPELPTTSAPPNDQIPSELEKRVEPAPESDSPKEAPIREQAEENEVLDLEELEDTEIPPKRRRRNLLKIDLIRQLESKLLKMRLKDVHIDTICENGRDAAADKRLPAHLLFRRSAHCTRPHFARMATELLRSFEQNLVACTSILQESDPETQQVEQPIPTELVVEQPLKHIAEQPCVAEARVNEEPDISMLPTQIIHMSPPAAVLDEVNNNNNNNVDDGNNNNNNNNNNNDGGPASNCLCHIGVCYMRHSLGKKDAEKIKRTQNQNEAAEVQRRKSSTNVDVEHPAKKTKQGENEPTESLQVPPEDEHVQTRSYREKQSMISSLLQESGLADLPPPATVTVGDGTTEANQNGSQRVDNGRSKENIDETRLGSPDRTPVALGESDIATESYRAIRTIWGTEGTLTKIVTLIGTGVRPLQLHHLLDAQLVPPRRAVKAALCFSSLLKLQKHLFIMIIKKQGTLKIDQIQLGPTLV